MLELDAGVSGGKAPVDADGLPIAFGLPSGDLSFQFRARSDATIQTLPREYREFDLGHVQPTAMLGRVMDFQLVDQASRLGWLKDLIQSGWGMGVQVIHDQHDDVSQRIADIHQVANEASEVGFGAMRGYLQKALACEWLARHKQITGPVPLVLIVGAFRLPWLHGDRK